MKEREFKDSGIPWIGEIPKDWEVVHIKHYCNNVYAGGTPQSNNLAYWDGNIPWIPSGSCQNNIITEAPKFITQEGFENSSTKLIPPYTTVMAMTGATCSNTGYVTFQTCMNQSVVAFIQKDDVFSKYLYYTLQAAKQEILTHQTGGAQSGINVEDCKNIIIPFISFEEQKAIAEFLDKKCGEIDELVALQDKMIEELKAYKQSIITETVTKGLNPNVPLKDSGIEWIGEIPQHWELLQIRRIVSLVRGGSPRPIEKFISTNQDGYNWIKIGDTIKGEKYIKSTKQKIIAEGLSSTRFVHKGDLILSNSMSFGQPYILDIEGCIHDGWLALSVTKKLNKEYLYYYLLSSTCSYQFTQMVDGGVVQNLNIEKVSTTLITVPPLSEQQEITEFLDKKCSEIDNLIELKQQKIEELKDYKKSLIYEYVTGKKQVETNAL